MTNNEQHRLNQLMKGDGEESINSRSDESESSDGSSNDDASLDTSGQGGDDDASKENLAEVQALSHRETRRIRTWRAIVVLLLVTAGALVAAGTYVFLSNEQKTTSTTSYVSFTHTIGDSSANHVRNMQQAFRGLAQTLTASSLLFQWTWPWITMPMWEVHGKHLRQQSGVEMVGFSPIITEQQRAEWLTYSQTHQGWIDEARAISGDGGKEGYVQGSVSPELYNEFGVTPPFPLHFPVWQLTPPPFDPSFINYDMSNDTFLLNLLPTLPIAREALFSDVLDLSILSGTAVSAKDHLSFHDILATNLSIDEAYLRPHSLIVQPVFRSLENTSDLVGLLVGVVPWDLYLTNLLPEGVGGISCILVNTCGQSFTYTLNGNAATYVGVGDLHDAAFDNTRTVIPLYDYIHPDTTPLTTGHCQYSFVVYSSNEFVAQSYSNTPLVFTTAVAVVFFLVIVTFFVYDRFVQRRNSKVVDAATRSNAILSSLFPSNVRARLFAENTQKEEKKATGSAAVTANLRDFMDQEGEELGYAGAPIADFFPDTTVMFADIAGFTAWSSVREPAQVFTLLETLYKAFDEIAKRRRVFKVETIGDCYVAVTGLPEPRKDHAVAMARFARECMTKMRVLTKKLEVSLGPDTGDLDMRAGLHSGPVTAGVLRGERSRFQLFGDTMNTASRMESTGLKGRIQVSQETADLLVEAGKAEWISQRKETVVAKGKGEVRTFWLDAGESRTETNSSAADATEEQGANEKAVEETEVAAPKAKPVTGEKTKRLVDWNVDVLARLLKQIVARRKASGEQSTDSDLHKDEHQFMKAQKGKTTMDEVKEIITLPGFNAKAAAKQENPDSVTLPGPVVEQLHDYVSNIASVYNENPFHNFEHASHVTMSVVKLLSRIVAPSNVENEGKTLHDHTYGITSDPLTQFACVFSALIHDADHPGVPNMQLVKEHTRLAAFYKGKSVAEQNSVDLAWHLLMEDAYTDLRRTIYGTGAELKRFRQLVVNTVMATDIVDKELKTLRNARWAKAFSGEADRGNSKDAVNRKATIVIEHLIQASDVAHTMQHWHIYRKWNERFFMECYKAYVEGRADNNPADTWYDGEIGFFDFYIIPLARKLKDCGVFGVSSDEYLNYALKNRKEWESRGREVVDEMVEKVKVEEWAQNVVPAPHRSVVVLSSPPKPETKVPEEPESSVGDDSTQDVSSSGSSADQQAKSPDDMSATQDETSVRGDETSIAESGEVTFGGHATVKQVGGMLFL